MVTGLPRKVVLRTALPAQGKGAALRLVFEYMLQVDAEFGLCLLVAERAHFTPFWDTRIPYRTEGVHFFGGGYELSN